MSGQKVSPVLPIGKRDKRDKTKSGTVRLAARTPFPPVLFVPQVPKGQTGQTGLNGRKAAMCKRL